MLCPVEVDKICHLIAAGDQGDIPCSAAVIQLHAGLMEEAHFVIFQCGSEIFLLRLTLTTAKIDLNIIMQHLGKLDIRHIHNGIPQAKASQQQSCTAADTHQHHQQPLTVAQDIAQHYLVQKAQFFPERQVFQQYFLSGCGCFGTDQLGRHLPKRPVAAIPCHKGGHQRISDDNTKAQLPVKGQPNIRCNIEQDAVGLPQHPREHHTADGHTQHTSDHRSAGRIQQILAHDPVTAVTQCLHGTDLGAFLIHHAGHGSDTDKRGDQQEEHRQYQRDAGHDIRVAVQRHIAHVGISGQNIDIRAVHIVNGLFRIRQLLLCFVQILFGIGKLCFRFCLSGFIVRPAGIQFCLRFF